MKFKVIGLKTEKVYYESNTRSDCFKKLTEMNPYIWSKRRGLTNDQLYPEPLMVVGPRVSRKHIKLTQNELHINNKM